MRRAILWFNVGLLAAVVTLAFAVWKQSREKSRWEELASKAASSIEQLQRRDEKAAQAVSPRGDAVASSVKAAETPEAKRSNEVTAEVRAERKRLSEEKNHRQSRLNAFHGYAEGFVVLGLPPQTEALAKETILRGVERASAIKWNEKSPEEALAESRQVIEATNAELIALVGESAFEQLEAHKIKPRLDWTIGTDLWDGGAPLTDQQLHALALAIVRLDYRDRLSAFELEPSQMPDESTWLSLQDHLLLGAAKEFLSPVQQELLRQNLIDENRYNAAWRDRTAIQRQRQIRP